LVESYLKKDSLISLYDTVLIPIITQVQTDFHLELINAEKRENVYQGISEIIEFLSITEQKEGVPASELKGKVLCLPARALRDELGAGILAQLLVQESFDARHTAKFNVDELVALIEKEKPDAACITVVAPFVLSHTRLLCTKLHQRLPQLPLVVGLWGLTEKVDPEELAKLKSAGVTKVVFTLAQAIEAFQEMRAANFSS
jgi:hypothetical protein